jgi:hypothetical protein
MHGIYDIYMSFVQTVCTNGYQSASKPRVPKWVCYTSHSYIDPRVVEGLHLTRSKHEKSWLVKLATGTKRKFTKLFKSYSVDMKGISTKVELNILPLGSYDCLIGMDWLDQHHALLDCRNKRFTCLNEEGN